jgi:hypothetical protein
MKTTAGKIRRSNVYYLMTKASPINENHNARSDTWGIVVVVVLLLGLVGLMRLILSA